MFRKYKKSEYIKIINLLQENLLVFINNKKGYMSDISCDINNLKVNTEIYSRLFKFKVVKTPKDSYEIVVSRHYIKNNHYIDICEKYSSKFTETYINHIITVLLLKNMKEFNSKEVENEIIKYLKKQYNKDIDKNTLKKSIDCTLDNLSNLYKHSLKLKNTLLLLDDNNEELEKVNQIIEQIKPLIK